MIRDPSKSIDKGLNWLDAEIDKAVKPGSWPPLIKLESPPPARLPVEKWPSVIADYAREASNESETPAELPAMLALGAAAAAVQRVLTVEVKPGYQEPCCLYIAIAMPPATRKSAEFKRATKPLVHWEAEQREAVQKEIKLAESKLKTHHERVKELRKKVAKTDDSQVMALSSELAKLEANEPVIPKTPRLWTSDTTTEHLATMLGEQNESLSVMSAEGGIFETMAGRYNQGQPNFDLYLSGHAGDAVRVDRGSKPSITLDDPRLSLVLALQPDVLTAMNTKPGFKGRGLLGRVLFILPPNLLGSRTGDTPLADHRVIIRYDQTINSLIEIGKSEAGARTLQLSKQALQAWQLFQQQIESELAEGGRFEYCRDWAGKLPGAVARIAGLFHAVEKVHDMTALPVSVETMQAAIQTGWALSEHAMEAFEVMGADLALEDAKHLLKWIKQHDV
mgnify:CR=1 FL=1